MKRAIKLCVSLAGVLLAVGVFCIVAGAVMGGRGETDRYFAENWRDVRWVNAMIAGEGIHIGGKNGIHVDSTGVDIGGEHGIHLEHHEDKDDGTAQSLDSGALSGITSIKVDVDCADISVREGEDCSVSLYWNISNYVMTYEVEGGVLKIEDESWGSAKSDDPMECYVLVTLPAGAALDELDLSTDMGDIDVDVTVTAKEADLSTDLGDVTCRGLQAKELEAETDLGDVTLHLPGAREEYRWALKADMGELCLDGNTSGGGLGTVTDRGGTGKNILEAGSALGDVEVYFGA